MGFMYWLRVVLMVFAFAGTVYVIREVNRPVGTAKLQTIFGLKPNPISSPIAAVNLCPTRVTRLELENQAVIRQDGMTWKRLSVGSATEVRLDQVAVEKWFGRYCTLEAPKVDPSADVKPVLKVEFVSGSPQTLIRSKSGEYEWMHQAFASDELSQALRELEALPEADPNVR